jgi:aminoglycoside 3-N-acetyltransferase
MTLSLVTRADVAHAACRIGLKPGGTVALHASLSTLGRVLGGAETVVRGLLDALGPEGTLAVPAQTWLNLDPSRGVHGLPEAAWPAIREHWPAFDPAVTPSVGMGAVAEAVRTWPGARRSDHPARSWAAIGPAAAALTARHDLEDVHGEASPLGALWERDATVVLLGVGYDKCTALHLAETRAAPADAPRTAEISAVLDGGERRRVAYTNLAFEDRDFPEIGDAFEACHRVPCAPIGDGTASAAPLRALVDFAEGWIRDRPDRTSSAARHRKHPGLTPPGTSA